MVSTTYTIAAYGVIGAAAALWYFSRNGTRARFGPRRGKSAPPESRRDKSKKQRADEKPAKTSAALSGKAKGVGDKDQRLPQLGQVDGADDGGSSSVNHNSTKNNNSSSSNSNHISDHQNTWLTNDAGAKEASINDREFARQLTTAKQGKKFATGGGRGGRGPENKNTRQKSVKQSRAFQVADFADDEKDASDSPSASASVPSSLAAAEADVSADPSPTPSPVVTPAETTDSDVPAGPIDPTGVADMLEPGPAGPSVLRLLSTGAAKPTAPKESKSADERESKKQRQNRKKVEQAKAMREEAEKERKKAMEAQRRLARVSEGRPAPDGSQFMASINGAQAWTEPGAKAGQAGATINPLELLGTSDAPASQSTLKAAPAAAATTNSSLNPGASWISALPSEEEQMEMVKEESEWSTVKTKSSKKLRRDESSTQLASETTAAAAAAPATKQVPAAAAARPTATLKASGSFAALRTDDDSAEEEEGEGRRGVETEWDV